MYCCEHDDVQYIWLSVTRIQQLTKNIRKCVFAGVFEHLFFLNKQRAQETHLVLYVIYWEPGVLVPLDHDSRHLHICMSYTLHYMPV